MARYRVGNSYLSEEEYQDHTSMRLVFWLSVIVFAILAYQTNAYLKLHYVKMFSAEGRVALATIPGFAAMIFMRVFREIISRLIGFALLGLFLFIIWKIAFYFLG